MDGSTLLRDKPLSPSSIVDEIKRRAEPPKAAAQNAAASPSPEDSQPWPDENTEYKAAGNNAAHPVETLFFLTKGRLPKGFAYANLEEIGMREGEKPGQAPVLVARFAGSRVTEVVIEGRGLLPICNALGRRVCPWLWEIPGKDFQSENATVITKIGFHEK